MLNKNGMNVQQFLAGLIVIAVLVFLVLLFTTDIFGGIREGTTSILPPALQGKASSCALEAEAGAWVAYCKTSGFDKLTVAGREQYINCQYEEIQSSIMAASEKEGFEYPRPSEPTTGCETIDAESSAFCENLKQSQPNNQGVGDVYVNGKKCSVWSPDTTGEDTSGTDENNNNEPDAGDATPGTEPSV